ncbi:MAG: DUF4893 domain-containing protein [Roseovarius sp.]
MIRTLIFALALAAPGMSLAEPYIRPADTARLAGFEAHLGAALKEALAEGAAADIALMQEAMRGAALASPAPEGDWKCRVMKMGGLLPLTAYPNFSCRITATGAGTWRIEKRTGSQLFRGTLTEVEGGILYRGVGFNGAAPARDYDELPPDDQTPVEPNQTTADIGWFEQMSAGRGRLMLPDPILESRFDLFYLTR